MFDSTGMSMSSSMSGTLMYSGISKPTASAPSRKTSGTGGSGMFGVAMKIPVPRFSEPPLHDALPPVSIAPKMFVIAASTSTNASVAVIDGSDRLASSGLSNGEGSGLENDALPVSSEPPVSKRSQAFARVPLTIRLRAVPAKFAVQPMPPKPVRQRSTSAM